MKTDRRDFIRIAAVLSAGAAAHISKAGNTLTSLAKPSGNPGFFDLPPLGYGFEALEPYIDAQTMQIHHDKHHQAYVTKLNEAIEKEPSLKGKTIDELVKNINAIPAEVRTAVRNNGGGHWNHSFFWQSLKKDTKPGDKTKTLANSAFGSMDNMKKEFEKAATGVFGSGWAWLIMDTKGKLTITSTPNQDNPLMDVASKHGRPILGVDVWEHAYYLKYQNKRADYLQAFWNVVNWERVESLARS